VGWAAGGLCAGVATGGRVNQRVGVRVEQRNSGTDTAFCCVGAVVSGVSARPVSVFLAAYLWCVLPLANLAKPFGTVLCEVRIPGTEEMRFELM